MKYIVTFLAPLLLAQSLMADGPWNIETQSEWKDAIASSNGLAIEKGMASPTGKVGACRISRFSNTSITTRSRKSKQRLNK